ncbi:MAG: hypothetical protein K9N29_01105 [Candidatus Marinimicrobia bacterium]|nr:hypothetical protein [Candidatus Neomarinimicrobiota bacterium]
MKMLRIVNLILITTLMISIVQAQTYVGSRFHDLGKLKHRIDTALYLDTSGPTKPVLSWPQGVYDSENCQFSRVLINVESYLSYLIDSTGGTHDTTIVTNEKYSNSYTSLGDLSDQGPPWGIYEYRRYAPPAITVDSNNDSYNFNGVVSDSLMSDVQIDLVLKSSPGFYVTQKTFSFANEFHDDYVIYHLNFKYTGDSDFLDLDPDYPPQDLSNVYFVIGYHMIPSFAGQKEIMYGSRWGGDAYDDWMDWESVTPMYPSNIDDERSDMLLVYGWDGDDTDVATLESGGKYFNDTGDPSFQHEIKGQFLSYQFPGYTLIHADKAADDPSDDPDMPQTLAIADIFETWANTFSGQPSYEYFSTGEKQHPPDWEDPGNSHWKKSDHVYMSLGPYDFSMGEDVDIVYAVGVGGVDYEETVTKGQEWLSWYRDEPGATFDDDAKRDFIGTGLDSLYDYLSRARWAWDRMNNDHPVPAPLPSPGLEVTSGGGFIKLEWEDMSAVPDPVTGIPDLAGYNVYRKLGAQLVNFKEDEFGKGIVYEKIAELGPDITEFLDTTAIRGENYRYFVTTVDDGTQNDGLFPGRPLESSHFQNRTSTGAVSFKPAPTHNDSVRVVPNPYILSGGELNFTGDLNKILFINLPAFCSINIYNATGDLVKTVEHTSGSGDEAWDQLSNSNQRIVSGVYIAYVTNCRNLDESKLPDVYEKFVVIR